MFNLIYAHLLGKTEHGADCEDRSCASGCTTQRFLDLLEEPFMPWEIEEESRFRERRRALERGVI